MYGQENCAENGAEGIHFFVDIFSPKPQQYTASWIKAISFPEYVSMFDQL